MTDIDRRILLNYAARIRDCFPDAQVWLYGSRARGDAGADSDFDMCVVLDGLDWDVRRAASEINWEAGFAYEVLITSVEFERSNFERGPHSESPLVINIRRDAIRA